MQKIETKYGVYFINFCNNFDFYSYYKFVNFIWALFLFLVGHQFSRFQTIKAILYAVLIDPILSSVHLPLFLLIPYTPKSTIDSKHHAKCRAKNFAGIGKVLFFKGVMLEPKSFFFFFFNK